MSRYVDIFQVQRLYLQAYGRLACKDFLCWFEQALCMIEEIPSASLIALTQLRGACESMQNQIEYTARLPLEVIPYLFPLQVTLKQMMQRIDRLLGEEQLTDDEVLQKYRTTLMYEARFLLHRTRFQVVKLSSG